MTAQNELTAGEVLRYSRHFALPGVGLEGQKRLKRAAVLLVGAGGLGSPLALYLAAAGVGRLGLVDFDAVEESNLQRQILHGTAALGASKVDSAAARLRDLNPHVDVRAHNARLTAGNAMDIVSGYDVVADGADNFPTRYLVNDAAFLAGKPLVSGAVQGFLGQLSVFNHNGGPCYRCLFPAPPPPGAVPSCAEGGVLGALPGVVGALQATEVIKILLGIGRIASGRLCLYDALGLSFDTLAVAKNPDCPLCGENPAIHSLTDWDYGRGPDEGGHIPVETITPAELRAQWAAHVVVDVREPHEREICLIEGSLHLPLGALETRRDMLGPDDSIVVFCKSGGRGLRAARTLMNLGCRNVKNLEGGILAWIDAVDPGQTKY